MANQESPPRLDGEAHRRLEVLRVVMGALAQTSWDLSVDDLITLAEYVRTGEHCRGQSSEHRTVTQREGAGK